MPYNFIVDWSKATRKNADHIFSKYVITPKTTMEIGVFEGQFSFWLLDYYPSIGRHVGIDCFSGNYEVDENVLEMVYDRFIQNLKECKHQHKFEFYKEMSVNALKKIEGTFDFIYIDGDHTAASVLEDLTLSFTVLNPGGVILCDDAVSWKYTHHSTKSRSSDLSLSPRIAVDSFIHCNWSRIDIIDLPNANQVAFQKK